MSPVRLVVNSQWFLDPEAWELLANELIAAMMPLGRPLRAWSAGCGNGKEPFSLAVLLREAHPELDYTILATDRDRSALRALRQRGPFGARDIENIPLDWRHRHLESASAAFAGPHLLERMTVDEHDLLRDPFPSELDLILCRNLETCFSPEENARIWQDFARALRPGGILFTGALDRVPPAATDLFRAVAPCLHVRC